MERRCCISRTTYVNQAAAPAIPAAGRVSIYALGDNLYQIDDAGVVTLLAGIPAHAATHENGGADEISVIGLSGLLADNQNAIPAAGIDTTAIHDNAAGEINAIAVKAAPVNADIVVIEDSAAGWAKKKAAANTLPARNLQAVCDVGNVTTTAIACGGAAVADGASTINDFVAGSLATDNHGITGLTSRWYDFGATVASGAADCLIKYDCINNNAHVWLGGAERYSFRVNDFRPNGNMVRSMGVNGGSFTRGFFGQRAMGVLQIGDASAALDDEEFVRIAEPAAGINTATLPAAVLGYTYIIEVTAGAGGTVNIATVGGDTINGAGSPLAGIGPGWHQLIAQDANDWRYVGPI